jgi:lysophospholipase L1-like esterase
VPSPELDRSGLARIAALVTAAAALVVSLVRSPRGESRPEVPELARPAPERSGATWLFAPPLPDASGLPMTPVHGRAETVAPSRPVAPFATNAARAALTAPNASRTILVIGDSHTRAGLWARAVGERLTAALPGRAIAIERLALVGARFTTWLGKPSEEVEVPIAAARPDVVIIALGTNDASEPREAGPREAAGMSALLARVRAVRPNVACFVVGPTPRYDATTAVERIRDALRARSAEEGCGFFDPTAWARTHGGWRAMRTMGWVHRDGIHLTNDGQRRLGQAVAAELLRE